MMSCRQAEKLLPLYVSSDLEAAREPLLTAHVQSCTRCSAVAAEYRQTRQLLRESAPPTFSEEIYSGIRQNVWRQIGSRSNTQAQWEVMIGWFRPRLTRALAAMVLTAVSVFGIYLISNRLTVPQHIAATTPATNSNASDGKPLSRSPEVGRLVALLPSSDMTKGRHLPERRAPRRTRRNVIPDRADSIAVAHGAPSSTADTSLGVNTSAQSDPGSDTNSENTLRMEIQTRNPNIRIIWFSQRDQKRASPNSKGI